MGLTGNVGESTESSGIHAASGSGREGGPEDAPLVRKSVA